MLICIVSCVIVSARNEQAHIGRCLSSLLDQSYPNLEVIAIDDNSNDATLRIMKDIKRTRPMLPLGRLKIIFLNDKPDNWTGKTWISQQGYLQSCGSNSYSPMRILIILTKIQFC